jgi:hypothetical protein
LKEDILLLIIHGGRDVAFLFHDLPAWKPPLQPILPVVVHGCGKRDHYSELGEEDAVEDEGDLVPPCFQALSYHVGTAVDAEGEEAGRHDWRKFHGSGRYASVATMGF